jgi:hypothetical protein
VPIGVYHRFGVLKDRDMAFPEDEVAAPTFVETDLATEIVCLHIAIPRRSLACHHERHLHQAGTVDAETGAPTPEIGRFQEAGGPGHVVQGGSADRRQMRGDHGLAVVRQRISRAAHLGFTGNP